MIQVVMFDLGMTLIDETSRPFPHVMSALTAIADLKTANQKPLRSCLVSDFTMATEPVTDEEVAALFKQYLAILDNTGLRRFFEPVNERVTLSTQAGARKPCRKIFEKALERLNVAVPLEDCLLVTEDPNHIAVARTTLNMKALQFRSEASERFDFEDWAKVPNLIAELISRA
jgi:FMN phosphatase YigB (HAD superfamily)